MIMTDEGFFYLLADGINSGYFIFYGNVIIKKVCRDEILVV